MVAETYGVVAHRVDGRDLEVSVQFGKVRRALAEVAGVDKEDILRTVGLADAVDKYGTLDDAAADRIDAVDKDRLEVRMGIVEVEDGQFTVPFRCAGRRNEGESRYDRKSFHRYSCVMRPSTG